MASGLGIAMSLGRKPGYEKRKYRNKVLLIILTRAWESTTQTASLLGNEDS